MLCSFDVLLPWTAEVLFCSFVCSGCITRHMLHSWVSMALSSSVCFYSAPVGERSILISLSVCVSVCLSVSISLELLDRSLQNFVCRSPVAVARSSSGSVVLHYACLADSFNVADSWDVCFLYFMNDRRSCFRYFVSVCLSTSISLEPLDRSLQNFVCISPVAMARSSFGGVVIRYVLPVLWMTSRLVVWRNVEAVPWSDYHEWHCETGAVSDECLVCLCINA